MLWADTGWVALTLSNGVVGQDGLPVQVRKIGDVVSLRGTLNVQNISQRQTWVQFTQVPAEFRPERLRIQRVVTWSGTASEATILHTSQGAMSIYVPDALSAYYSIDDTWMRP